MPFLCCYKKDMANDHATCNFDRFSNDVGLDEERFIFFSFFKESVMYIRVSLKSNEIKSSKKIKQIYFCMHECS